MAKINLNCECGEIVEAEVGQKGHKKITWFMSYKCHICGRTIEEDGIGETPEVIRKAIITQEGEYGLLASESEKNITALIVLIRKVLKLNLKETMVIKKLIPGVILKGSKVEMERIQLVAREYGMDTLVEKI